MLLRELHVLILRCSLERGNLVRKRVQLAIVALYLLFLKQQRSFRRPEPCLEAPCPFVYVYSKHANLHKRKLALRPYLESYSARDQASRAPCRASSSTRAHYPRKCASRPCRALTRYRFDYCRICLSSTPFMCAV